MFFLQKEADEIVKTKIKWTPDLRHLQADKAIKTTKQNEFWLVSWTSAKHNLGYVL